MDITPRQLEIIEAAGKILTASGVSGLTIKNLAKEMHFSESAIYRHFASKEEIIVAMLNYLANDIDIRLSNQTKPADPEQQFRLLFREQFRFFSENPHFVVAVFSDGLMEESLLINQNILKLMNIKIKHLMPIIMEGQQKGMFTNAITTDELMHIIMGTFKLQMFKWRIANFEFDIKRSGDNMVQSILTLIKNKLV
ncbi:MAG: TetR/AcrR family transcriptional regulator [Bacteroidales bacterium]|nr:TetR/AcrR family transcriptional regulator [Bacteroidales bacterium]